MTLCRFFGNIFSSGVLVTVSAALHIFTPRILPAKLVCFAPAFLWGFTCLCLRKGMGISYVLMLTLHIILVSVWCFNFGTSSTIMNRILLYPLAGSVIALAYINRLPSVPVLGMVGVILIQLWSVAGGILMLAIYPASVISNVEPQEMRGRRLTNFIRQAEKCEVVAMTVPSSNGIQLDAVVVLRQEKTDKWILYFGGNAELMEDCAEEMSGITDIVKANWVFYNARGVGRSDGYVAEVRSLVDDAAHVVRYVTKRYAIPPTKLVLWGHSIGGGVAAAVAQREGLQSPLVLDRTFSSLSDAAVKFSPLHPAVTKVVIRYTVGDLDVVANCKALTHNKTLVIYHRMDEVITYNISSLGRKDALKEMHVDKNMLVELRSTRVQSPHNSLLTEFDETETLSQCINTLFQ